jgi:2'-5' RNA ligase
MIKLRGFIAIEIKPTSNIQQFINDISKSNADVKLVEYNNLHLTLKFLGDIQENSINDIERSIKDAVHEIQPFTIQLKGTGVFPNKNYIRVIWIGIKNSEILSTISVNIDNNLTRLGFKKDKKGFSVHLTIGRVRTAKNKSALLNIIERYTDFKFSTQEVNSIKLKKSQLTPKGPIYTTLKDIKL